MTNQRQQTIAFFLLLGLTALLVLLVWLPFLKLLALGAILAVLFFPIHRRLAAEIKSEAWAALLTIILILLIVMVPLYLVGQALFGEIYNLYSQYKQGGLLIDKTAIIHSLPLQLQDWAVKFSADLAQKVSVFAADAFTGMTAVVSNVANFVLSLVLVFFTVYYLLRDGKKIQGFFNSIFPMSRERESAFAGKITNAIAGVIKGSFIIALVQGGVATVGFLIFGVPEPFVWGIVTVLAALVPNFGTSLSLIPAVIYLFITGHTGAGIGLAIWGALAVGTIDNIISPKLIGSKSNIHPLLVLFSVIGGLQFFGYLGFLLGPILMAVFLALLDIYRQDAREYLK